MKDAIMDNLIFDSRYKCYTADSCRKTGLIMFGSSDTPKSKYSEYADKYLSKSRCKLIKKPVKDDEQPIAFYRVMNGYVPLYDRSNNG